MDTYQQIAAQCKAAFPSETGRIRSALRVLRYRRILDTGELGVYRVQAREPAFWYQTTSLTCTCQGARRNPERQCSHSWAMTILSAASAVLAREARERGA